MQLSLSVNLTNTLTNSARREAVLQAKQVAALYSQVRPTGGQTFL